ncbi:hypothetical protein Salat_2161800 [Sesamum alatum]|uniref:Uncharacterized protein n=1 Tax=Sesamum alatum TaxID=300844 RepID=A0AAE1Y1P5_9LAMI|nr:hypothetical protein Salat_2161800 [Sesamum alatum]
MRDCPKKENFNTLVAEVNDDDEGHTDQPFAVVERIVGEAPTQIERFVVCSGHIKAVKLKVKPIQGIAVVNLRVEAWQGKCDLMPVPLDDFHVILGMDFICWRKLR